MAEEMATHEQKNAWTLIDPKDVTENTKII